MTPYLAIQPIEDSPQKDLRLLSVSPIEGGFSTEYMGTKGLLASFVAAFLTVNLYKFCVCGACMWCLYVASCVVFAKSNKHCKKTLRVGVVNNRVHLRDTRLQIVQPISQNFQLSYCTYK